MNCRENSASTSVRSSTPVQGAPPRSERKPFPSHLDRVSEMTPNPGENAGAGLRGRVDEVGALVADVVDVGADGADLEEVVGRRDEQLGEGGGVVVGGVEPGAPR